MGLMVITWQQLTHYGRGGSDLPGLLASEEHDPKQELRLLT